MNINKRHKAAIVGLGQVGLLFDEDPKRSGVWTHVAAYERLADRFDLIAACDVDSARLSLVKRRVPDIQCYSSLEDMLAATRPDVVSICTPPGFHAEQISTCAGKVRSVICEKPLSLDVEGGESAIRTCEGAGTLVAVNYYKRYDGCIPHVVERLNQGAIGDFRTVTAWYSGPFDAVGSHVIDLLRYLLGPLSVKSVHAVTVERYTAILTFGAGGLAVLHATGPREDFIFEMDLLGSKGRIRILDNCTHAEFYRFEESRRYGGYRELFLEPCREYVSRERFLPLFLEVADQLDGKGGTLIADGRSALASQEIMENVSRKIKEMT